MCQIWEQSTWCLLSYHPHTVYNGGRWAVSGFNTKPQYPRSFWSLGSTLRWRHNGHDSVSNNQPQDCLLNRLFRRISKKTPKLRVTGLCAGNSPGTGEFPAQMASNAENVSIWWRHHEVFPGQAILKEWLVYFEVVRLKHLFRQALPS